VTTVSDVLAGALRHAAGRPLLTFYVYGTGERTELSVATYANWVAKTAGLLVEECDLGRGARVLVDVPTHWLGPVFLGAAWSAGMQVVWSGDAEAVVCGPDGLARWASLAEVVPVLATALHPLATRFPDPLPPGVLDVGIEVWSQPDDFVPWDPPQPGDPAVPDRTQEQLWQTAGSATLVGEGGRLLSTENPASASGLAAFTEPLVRSGSMVLVAHPDQHQLPTTYAAERCTSRFPPDSQPARS
jgi:uncharacterized protein (TIGR03089 family)